MLHRRSGSLQAATFSTISYLAFTRCYQIGDFWTRLQIKHIRAHFISTLFIKNKNPPIWDTERSTFNMVNIIGIECNLDEIQSCLCFSTEATISWGGELPRGVITTDCITCSYSHMRAHFSVSYTILNQTAKMKKLPIEWEAKTWVGFTDVNRHWFLSHWVHSVAHCLGELGSRGEPRSLRRTTEANSAWTYCYVSFASSSDLCVWINKRLTDLRLRNSVWKAEFFFLCKDIIWDWHADARVQTILQ